MITAAISTAAWLCAVAIGCYLLIVAFEKCERRESAGHKREINSARVTINPFVAQVGAELKKMEDITWKL